MSPARSSKLRKKRRKVFYFKMSAFFFLIISFAGLLIYGFNTKYVTIQDVTVSGAQEFVNHDVEEYVRRILAGSYFGLMSKENIFLYPKGEIESGLLQEFPRLEKVAIELDPFEEQVLSIAVSERRENGVWCRTVWVADSEEQDCYFIDKEGYIFAPAPIYSEGVMFEYRGFVEGEPLNSQFIEADTLAKINAFVRAIENDPQFSEFEPVVLEYVAVNEYKLHLASGGYIHFSDAYGLAYAYENLAVSLKEGIIDSKNLTYIDIRIPNKVFFKHLDTVEVIE